MNPSLDPSRRSTGEGAPPYASQLYDLQAQVFSSHANRIVTDEQTDFGYQRVTANRKTERVREVFDSVSPRYDLMNDLMSFGIHRLWKRFAVAMCRLCEGQRVLDVAAGTGDMALRLVDVVGERGQVVMTDINAQMLAEGRDRIIDAGFGHRISLALADAEALPFESNHFDCVCIAFGLRNVTHKARALESMFRVLRPGGRVVILEFSTLSVAKLQPLYDKYSFSFLPKLGQLVANDAESYQYLVESIRMHPDQQQLKALMECVGFERCEYQNLTAGIAAIHRGYKL